MYKRIFKDLILFALSFCVGAAVLFLVAGCGNTSRHVTSRDVARPDAATVVEAQTAKDATVLGEADKIDALAPEVRVHTDAQRMAVAVAPAADIAKLTKEYEAVVNKLQGQVERLISQNDKLKDVELRWQGRMLTGIGIACFVGFGFSFLGGGVGAFVTMKKTWPLPLMGFGALGSAQIVTHPWFMWVISALLLAMLAYTIWWIVDRKRQGRLAEALAKRTDALKQIVPVLDNAKAAAGESLGKFLDNHVFDVLSVAMSRDEKDEVKKIREEQRPA